MEMWMIGFIVGLATALVALVVFYVLSKNKENFENKSKVSYDERQKKARGEAYRVGFITVLICLLLLAIAEIVADEKKIEISMFLPITVAAFFSLTVFACVCVWKDAWLSLKDKPLKIIVSSSIIMIFNLTIGICNYNSLQNLLNQDIKIIDSLNMEKLLSGLPYESVPYEPSALQVYAPIINIICAAMLFAVLINYFLKLAVDKSREKREMNEES